MTLSKEEVLVGNRQHAFYLTKRDLDQINHAASWVSVELSGMGAYELCFDNLEIYYLGKLYGFNDTEVRAKICTTLLERK